MSAAEQSRPVLRVVRGDATPEEIAALVAVLAARSAGGEPPAAPAPVSGWRGLPRRGPDAWRLSSWGITPGLGGW